MDSIIKNRLMEEVNYILDEHLTIRKIAIKMGLGKSTIHKDLNNRLNTYNKKLYLKVKEELKNHFINKHINGGSATKRKYKGEYNEKD